MHRVLSGNLGDRLDADYRLQAHLGLEGCTVSLPLRLGLHGTDHLEVDQNLKP